MIASLNGSLHQGTPRTDIPKRTDLSGLPPCSCKENKAQLLVAQYDKCAGCGETFLSRNLEVNHIIAEARGGPDRLENLQLLCGYCNRVKGDRGMEYLRVKLQL